ncbi:MAG TPA: hypothetical protein ENN76_01965 [Euryarchaeota archaeon]|nr:hypothetical protein [Euryarchaeota archaeon]
MSSRTDDDVVDFHLEKSKLHEHEGLEHDHSGRYSLTHLHNVVKNIKGKNGTLSMGASTPLSLEFSLSKDAIKGTYLLAPRD